MIASAESCDGTSSNVRQVNACPLTEEEWIKASDRKKCGNDNHACSSFIYHCVLNTWRNETLELCAPSINIVGKIDTLIEIIYFVMLLFLKDLANIVYSFRT